MTMQITTEQIVEVEADLVAAARTRPRHACGSASHASASTPTP